MGSELVAVVTETALGWAGVALSDRGIRQATLFHRTRASAEGEMAAFGDPARLIGDVDDDGDVDVTDISAVANAWLDPALNPVLDITISGYIDVIDATATASRFGLVCS